MFLKNIKSFLSEGNKLFDIIYIFVNDVGL